MLAMQRNPDKLEAKAQLYEQRGKTAKAMKYREKAAKMRQHQAAQGGAQMGSSTQRMGSSYNSTTTTTTNQLGSSYPYTQRTPARYEQNAVKWEQRGNYAKAQKNREKVWRQQNPQHQSIATPPQFYNNNQFVGYNVRVSGGGVGGGSHTVMPATVTRHVHDTILEQTSRPERIVEIQPIVHRQIDAPEMHIIEQHSYESVASQGPSTFTNAAIVQETVRPHITEEVQSIVHREVPAPFVERVEQHTTEHLVMPTTHTKEVQQGGMTVNAQQQFIPAGGLQQTTTTTTIQQQQGMAGNMQNNPQYSKHR